MFIFVVKHGVVKDVGRVADLRHHSVRLEHARSHVIFVSPVYFDASIFQVFNDNTQLCLDQKT